MEPAGRGGRKIASKNTYVFGFSDDDIVVVAMGAEFVLLLVEPENNKG